MPRDHAAAEPAVIEPSILVADLAEIHAAVGAIASGLAAAPRVPDAAAREREITVAAARSDAVAFSAAEEAFFEAGHGKDAHADSFDDLDEGYQRLGFWDRLRGKTPPRPPSHGDLPAGSPATAAKTDKK